MNLLNYTAFYVSDADGTWVELRDENGAVVWVINPKDYEDLITVDCDEVVSYIWEQ